MAWLKAFTSRGGISRSSLRITSVDCAPSKGVLIHSRGMLPVLLRRNPITLVDPSSESSATELGTMVVSTTSSFASFRLDFSSSTFHEALVSRSSGTVLRVTDRVVVASGQLAEGQHTAFEFGYRNRFGGTDILPALFLRRLPLSQPEGHHGLASAMRQPRDMAFNPLGCFSQRRSVWTGQTGCRTAFTGG